MRLVRVLCVLVCITRAVAPPPVCPAGQYSQCVSSTTWNVGYGLCATYAFGHFNGLDNNNYCVQDGACEHCCECINKCPAYNSPLLTRTQCIQCPANTYSGSGATTCTACESGKTSIAGSSVCVSAGCAAGTYVSGGGCTNCAPGSYSTVVGASVCTGCSAGTYSTATGASAAATCLSCPASSNSPISSSSLSACTCNVGFTGPNGGPCTACVAGKYKTTIGSVPCTDCLAGSYSTSTGATIATTCITCPSSSISYSASSAAADCTCNAGFTGPNGGVCSACVAGKYKINTGSAACSDCGIATYSTSTGATLAATCIPCQANATSAAGSVGQEYCYCKSGYAHAAGAYTCRICDPGTWNSQIGRTACSNCSVGLYSVHYGATGNETCLSCPLGQWSPEGSPNCNLCPVNSRAAARSGSQTDCACNAGYAGPNGGVCTARTNLTCSACPANSYHEQGQCLSCTNNTVSVPGSLGCQCKAGFTGSPDACQACPAGTYKRMAGTSGCRGCQANSRSDIASALCSCNMGYTANNGDVCVACVAGKYKDVIGSAACTACAANRNSPVASIDLTNCTCNSGYTHDPSKVNLAGSCGPNAACETVYGGISGSNAIFSSSVLTDGDINTISDGPGFASWIRIDFGRNISMDTIVLWNGNTWNHQYWYNYYAFDVSVFMSPSASFDSQAVQCIGPVAELWWTRAQLQSGTAYAKRSKTLKCVDDSTVSGRYLYVTYPPGTHTWIAFGEIQVYVSATDAQRLLISSQLTYQQPCALCDVGKFKGISGTQACTSCGQNQSSVAASLICSCIHGFTGPDGGPCAECAQGKYKDLLGSQPCTTCPSDSNTADIRSTLLTNCTCNTGYTGPNGGPCTACVGGKYKNVTGSSLCITCSVNFYSTKNLAATSCAECAPFSQSQAQSVLSQCLCNAGYQGLDFTNNLARTCGSGSEACNVVVDSNDGRGRPGSSVDNTGGLSVVNDNDLGGSLSAWVSNGNNAVHWVRIDFGKQAFVTSVQVAVFTSWFMPIDAVGHVGFANAGVIVGNNADVLSNENSICTIIPSFPAYFGGYVTYTCTTPVRGRYIFLSNRCGRGGNCYMLTVWELKVEGFSSDVCTACASGTYKSITGTSKCLTCPVNTYHNTTAVSSVTGCLGCPENSVSLSGESICFCDKGATGPDGGPCVKCEAGKYKNWRNSSACPLCHSNADSTEGFALCTCNAGYTGSVGSSNEIIDLLQACGSSENERCKSLGCGDNPPSTYPTHLNSLFNDNDYTTLGGIPAGWDCRPAGWTVTALPIDFGREYIVTSVVVYVEIGWCSSHACGPAYTVRVGNTPPGWSPETNNELLCPASTPSYEFSPRVTINGVQFTKFTIDCGRALRGRYFTINKQNVQWSSATMAAHEMKVMGIKDYTACVACGVGKYKNKTLSNDVCTTCPANSYEPDIGAVAVTNCTCNVGFEGGLGGPCTACVLGKYKNNNDSVPCLSCPVDTYIDVEASAYCKNCLDYTTSPSGSTARPACQCKQGYTGLGGSSTSGVNLARACGADGATPCATTAWSGSAAFANDNFLQPQTPQGAWAINTVYTESAVWMYIDFGKVMEVRDFAMHVYGPNDWNYPGMHRFWVYASNTTTPNGVHTAHPFRANMNWGPEMLLNDGSIQSCVSDVKRIPGTTTFGTCAPADFYVSPKVNWYDSYTSINRCICGAPVYGRYLMVWNLWVNPNYLHIIEWQIFGPPTPPCSACQIGKYKDTVGSSWCTSCPPSTFSGAVNATSIDTCSSCQGNSTSLLGSASKDYCQCNVGFIHEGAGCAACLPGTYNPRLAQIACSNCTVGTYSLNYGATSNETCASCSATEYSPEGSALCQPCPPNSVAAAGSSRIQDCGCTFGYTGATASLCEKCAPGSFKNITGNWLCQSCSVNSYSLSGATALTACFCNPGYTGAYGPFCVACVIGKYKSVYGSSACTDCPVNTYADRTGMTVCTSCVATSASPVASVTIWNCTCNAGYKGPTYLDVVYHENLARSCGGMRSSACVATQSSTLTTQVSVGVFEPMNPATLANDNSSSTFSMTAYDTNQWWRVDFERRVTVQTVRLLFSTFAVDMLHVHVGDVNSSTANLICASVPVNTGSSDWVTATCSSALSGRYLYVRNSIASQVTLLEVQAQGTEVLTKIWPDWCEKCPVGTYKPVTGNVECTNCPSNRFSSSLAATSISTCLSCPANSVAAIGSDQCACDVGFSGPANACTACASDTFKTAVGSGTCAVCPANSVIALNASTLAMPCTCLSGFEPR